MLPGERNNDLITRRNSIFIETYQLIPISKVNSRKTRFLTTAAVNGAVYEICMRQSLMTSQSILQ